MLKILQARLQQCLNQQFPDVQAGFRKGKGTRSNCKHPLDHRKKQENFRGTSTSASLAMLKDLNVWVTTNSGNLSKRLEYQTTLPASWDPYMQVKEQHLELDIEQQTDFKLGKEYVKAVYCHSAHLTYMQSTSCEMLAWMKHKLKSRLPGEISINLRYAYDTTLTAES